MCDTTRACNEFTNFFTEKTQNISLYITYVVSSQNKFEENDKSLEDIMHQLSSSFCCLKVLPTVVFKRSFACHSIWFDSNK